MHLYRLRDIPAPFLRLALAAAIVAVPAASSTGAVGAPAPAVAAMARPDIAASTWDAASWDESALGGINRQAFSTALEAAEAAVSRGDVVNPSTLTIIDFNRPSTQKRLWVFDLRSHALLFDELVSHGRGSGQAMATAFSNEPDSNKSSLGLFRTAEAYFGKHGLSLRLDGLERGINDRARERAIVIHGATYVSATIARAQGYLGRSLGCPAVRPEIARALIETVKNGSLLFAYGPSYH
jgi:hypothetical protein